MPQHTNQTENTIYKYPDKLIEFLTDQETEGNEITTVQNVDGVMWIIPERSLDNWVILVSWYPGDETFSTMNICGKAFTRLQKVMQEICV